MMCFMKNKKRAKTNHCVIVLLDDTQLVHELQANSTGQDLLDVVIKHLNLLETSYFGLRYLDSSHLAHNRHDPHRMEQVWLDVNKSAIKQLRDVQPMTVYFGVKYYASDPCKLAEEITRYQFFLQCKQDILHCRLPVSFELAIELFALAVQSELGDYDPQRHQEGYVSEFQFLAHQSADLEHRVALFHRNLTGQVPATAELNFLERVKWLDLYGCELHPIQYEDSGEEYALGLNPSGVMVLRNKLKVAHYLWPRIVKTKCQGRCFLMDVIDNNNNNNKPVQPGVADTSNTANRNRFGFRLVDKEASRRLRWAIEDHKSFHHLLHSSATLNQVRRQQLQAKLSHRFRNSIRSAINLGGQPQLKLRSSIKSLGNQQIPPAAMMQQYQPEHLRPPPTVIRMPSRRYSNRSMTRPGAPFATGELANGNGLPNVSMAGSAHTMVDSQKQQALLMMSQMNGLMGKSQTLKPMPSNGKLDSREAKRNPYYQMMMMMAMQQNNGQPQQQVADVAILPPGRHIVQPSVYKASSVVNGMSQLGQPQLSSRQSMALQFFNTKAQYPSHQYGHESPKSTKSAIAPSTALKLASKRLAKQQQLANHYANQRPADLNPPIDYDQRLVYNAPYYGVSMPYSANPSPRSVRSARVSGSKSRHKSKSIGENLHLAHQGQKYIYPNEQFKQPQRNKMLLTTTHQMMQHQMPMVPPPPAYHPMMQQPQQQVMQQMVSGKQRHLQQMSDNESDPTKLSQKQLSVQQVKRRPNLSQPAANNRSAGSRCCNAAPSDGEDDYCCSRSDCSSVEQDNERARLVGGQQRRRRGNYETGCQESQPQQHWNAIRKRHNDFNDGKGFLNEPLGYQVDERNSLARRPNYASQADANNNQPISSTAGHNPIKNIANKQATPILLSMNYDQSNANSKAVQMLNMQRQQLNSSQGDSAPADNNNNNNNSTPNKGQPSVAADSGSSSVASSPQLKQAPGSAASGKPAPAKTSDSTASSSTTSGYYAGSNSTGSASLDSDSQVDAHAGGRPKRSIRGPPFDDWHEDQAGSRAKIVLGAHAARLAANQRPMHAADVQQNSLTRATQKTQQRFYLGDTSAGQRGIIEEPDCASPLQGQESNQWSPLSQIQQHAPSSLKYVSFDV